MTRGLDAIFTKKRARRVFWRPILTQIKLGGHNQILLWLDKRDCPWHVHFQKPESFNCRQILMFLLVFFVSMVKIIGYIGSTQRYKEHCDLFEWTWHAAVRLEQVDSSTWTSRNPLSFRRLLVQRDKS